LHSDIPHHIIHPNIHLSLPHSLHQQYNHPISTHVLPAVRNCIQTFRIASSIPISTLVFPLSPPTTQPSNIDRRTACSQESHPDIPSSIPSSTSVFLTLSTNNTTIQHQPTYCLQSGIASNIHLSLPHSLHQQHNHPTSTHVRPAGRNCIHTFHIASSIQHPPQSFSLSPPRTQPSNINPRTTCRQELHPHIPYRIIHPTSTSVFFTLSTNNTTIQHRATYSLQSGIASRHSIIHSNSTSVFFTLSTNNTHPTSTHVRPAVRNCIQTFHHPSQLHFSLFHSLHQQHPSNINPRTTCGQKLHPDIPSSSPTPPQSSSLSTNNTTIQHQPTHGLQSGIASRHSTSHHPSQHPPQSYSLSQLTTQPSNINPRTACSQKLQPDIPHRHRPSHINLSLPHSLHQPHNHPTLTHVRSAVRN